MVNQNRETADQEPSPTVPGATDAYLAEIGKGVLLANAQVKLLEEQLQLKFQEFENHIHKESVNHSNAIAALKQQVDILESSNKTLRSSMLDAMNGQKQQLKDNSLAMNIAIKDAANATSGSLVKTEMSLSQQLDSATKQLAATKRELEQQLLKLQQNGVAQSASVQNEILTKLAENQRTLDAELEILRKKQFTAFLCAGIALFFILSQVAFLTVKAVR